MTLGGADQPRISYYGEGTRGSTDTGSTFVYDLPGTYTVEAEVQNDAATNSATLAVHAKPVRLFLPLAFRVAR